MRRILAELRGVHWIMGMLMYVYGSGLRSQECLRQRVKDLEFERLELTIRDAKGMKDRVTMMPQCLVRPLSGHLDWVRHQHWERVKWSSCICRTGRWLLPPA